VQGKFGLQLGEEIKTLLHGFRFLGQIAGQLRFSPQQHNCGYPDKGGPYVLGILSLIVLAIAIAARRRLQLVGGWPRTYAATAVIALYNISTSLS